MGGKSRSGCDGSALMKFQLISEVELVLNCLSSTLQRWSVLVTVSPLSLIVETGVDFRALVHRTPSQGALTLVMVSSFFLKKDLCAALTAFWKAFRAAGEHSSWRRVLAAVQSSSHHMEGFDPSFGHREFRRQA